MTLERLNMRVMVWSLRFEHVDSLDAGETVTFICKIRVDEYDDHEWYILLTPAGKCGMVCFFSNSKMHLFVSDLLVA